eukprot:TRINITY_DN4941_c0_g1_i1.p1 TRINITY_DN4941_c0_g1~~TRINITY_DN4941_c0_g1_i1.p1  ORF type:complete len:1664 (+),score=378.11 TRINITY_DN4941_c0_g1_i1:107-5098(+)
MTDPLHLFADMIDDHSANIKQGMALLEPNSVEKGDKSKDLSDPPQMACWQDFFSPILEDESIFQSFSEFAQVKLGNKDILLLLKQIYLFELIEDSNDILLKETLQQLLYQFPLLQKFITETPKTVTKGMLSPAVDQIVPLILPLFIEFKSSRWKATRVYAPMINNENLPPNLKDPTPAIGSDVEESKRPILVERKLPNLSEIPRALTDPSRFSKFVSYQKQATSTENESKETSLDLKQVHPRKRSFEKGQTPSDTRTNKEQAVQTPKTIHIEDNENDALRGSSNADHYRTSYRKNRGISVGSPEGFGSPKIMNPSVQTFQRPFNISKEKPPKDVYGENKKIKETLSRLREQYDPNKTNKDLVILINDQMRDLKLKYEAEIRDLKEKCSKTLKIYENKAEKKEGLPKNTSNIPLRISKSKMKPMQHSLSHKAKIPFLGSELLTEVEFLEYLEQNRLYKYIPLFFPEKGDLLRNISIESQIFEKEKNHLLTLVHAPLDFLIQLLTIPENSPLKSFFHYDRFLYHFLLVFPAFITPSQFLYKLIDRWNAFNENQEIDGHAILIRAAILNVLREWKALEISRDFQHDQLKKMLDDFVESSLKQSCLGANELFLPPLEKRQREYPPPQLPSVSPFILTDVPALEIARQLTLISSELLSRIDRTQFLDKNWYGADKKEKAPDFLVMIEHSNEVTRWVTTEILKFSSNEDRALAIIHFIHVLQHLKELNNFNSIIQILSSLHSSTVSKLKNSWKLITKKEKDAFDSVTQLMSTAGHYKSYHEQLALVNDSTPCIPLMPIICSDLFSINDTLSNTNEMDWINWRKFHVVGSRLNDIARFGTIVYNLEPIPVIQSMISDSEKWDDDICYEIASLLDNSDGSELELELPRYTNTDDLWKNEGLTERDWKLLLTGAKLLEIPENTIILEQGKKNTNLYRIEAGLVTVQQNGKELAVLSTGDIFGEISMLSKGKTTATVTTITNVDVYQIDVTLVNELCISKPRISIELNLLLAQKLSNIMKKNMSKLSKNTETTLENSTQVNDKEIPVKRVNFNEIGRKPINRSKSADKKPTGTGLLSPRSLPPLMKINTKSTNEPNDLISPRYNRNKFQPRFADKILKRVKSDISVLESSSTDSFSDIPQNCDFKDPKRKRVISRSKKNESRIKKRTDAPETTELKLDNSLIQTKSDVSMDSPHLLKSETTDEMTKEETEISITQQSKPSFEENLNKNNKTSDSHLVVPLKKKSASEEKLDVPKKCDPISPRVDLFSELDFNSVSVSSPFMNHYGAPSSFLSSPRLISKVCENRRKKSVKSNETKSRRKSDKEEKQKNKVNSMKEPKLKPNNLSECPDPLVVDPLPVQKEGEGTDAKFQKFFSLPGEVVVREFQCVLLRNRKPKAAGTLYISQKYICFGAINKVGSKIKEMILFKDITVISYNSSREAITIGVSPDIYTSISIIFKSFAAPNEAHKFITDLWKRQNVHHKQELKDEEELEAPGEEQIASPTKIVEEEDWRLILKGGKTVKYMRDEVIIHEGEYKRKIFQITRGQCRIVKDDHIIANIGPNNDGLFGEMSFLDDTASQVTVIANEKTTIHVIEAYYLNILFQRYPRLAARFYHHLSCLLSRRCTSQTLTSDPLSPPITQRDPPFHNETESHIVDFIEESSSESGDWSTEEEDKF